LRIEPKVSFFLVEEWEMQIEIHSRHFALRDELREKIRADLEKLKRFSPRPPVSVRLTIVNDKGRFTADLGFFMKNNDFRAKAEATEPDLAADEAVENIKTQLRRFKGKLSARQKGEEGGLGRAMLAENQGSEAAGTPQPQKYHLEDMSVERAIEVYSESDHPFFVFRNVDTSRLNVLYQRKNGEYGLLEPDHD
jgi:putative sigma-54 modulation protein